MTNDDNYDGFQSTKFAITAQILSTTHPPLIFAYFLSHGNTDFDECV
jgi:hypothetical protein